jgi:hypothetical protein
VSKLLGWIEWAEFETHRLQPATQATRGNIFVYEECVVWSHPNKATSRERFLTGRKTKLLEQGYQEAGLSPEELVAKHEKNWRLGNDEVKRAWCHDYHVTPNAWVEGAPGDDYWAADLELELLDGSRRRIHFRRVAEDDHDIWNRFEGWLGDRLMRGQSPAGKGLKGLLTKINRA